MLEKNMALSSSQEVNNNTIRPIVFSGSFDPWTQGHLSVVQDYLSIFPQGKVRILVGKHPVKKNIFTSEERKFLIEKTISQEISNCIEVEIYDGVIADYVYENNCAGILKGARNGVDFEYEMTYAHVNSYFSGKVKTIILPQIKSDTSKISSSMTKLIDEYGGDITELVHPLVKECLRMKRKGQLILGITGGTGSGKSTLSRNLCDYSKEKDVKIFHIDVDTIAYEIYQQPTNSLMNTVRNNMIRAFGEGIVNGDETINRKILGNIVFSQSGKKELLSEIIGEAFIYMLNKKINSIQLPGIILLDWALFVEYKQTHLCDENLILVHTSETIQQTRIQKRDNLSQEEIDMRMKNQLSFSERKNTIKQEQGGKWDRYYLELEGNNSNIEKIYEQLSLEFQKRKNIVR